MHNPPPAVPPSPVAAEQQVRALLAQEKWRQARDELKPLIKADRGRFLPLLIEANLGLGRKMLANGQTAEARQVLNYLATIAPAARLRTFELEIAGKSATSEQSLPVFVAALVDSHTVLSEVERVRYADRVVLAFQPVPAGEPAQARLAAEVRAVHDALRAVAEARWQDGLESLRLIPHRSMVSHWAVFIKGIAAFYGGETGKAVKLLHSLPPDSAPARASRAYLVLAGEPAPAPPLAEAVLEGACRLAGAGGVSGILLRVEKLWRTGNHVESYRVLRDAVPQFPSQGLDAWSALTEFYVKAPHGMLESEWPPFLRFFAGLIDQGRLKNQTESMLAHRMIALMGSGVAPAHELRHHWEYFLRQHEALHGNNARLASLAYGWLGEKLAMTRRAPGFLPGRPQLRDSQGAVEVLCRSIELDPANLAAHLQLGAVYEAQKKNSERNRLLDEMTARFPDDKQVLVQAARGCIGRNAFGKGLDYLARARQLDQLDPLIPELTTTALQRLARQQFQQRRPDKARQTLAQTEGSLSDKADDFQRSRWIALIRHGLMERLWGEAPQGESLLARARDRAPGLAAYWLFAHLTHRSYVKAYRCESPFLTELKQTLRRATRLGDIGLLLRILEYWKRRAETLSTYEEENLLVDCLAAAQKQPFTRTEAAGVFEHAHDNPEFSRPLRKLVKKILREDPLDPQFRLWMIDVDDRWRDPSGSRAELQSILDEAVRRHDETVIRKARQMLRDLDHPPPPPRPDAYAPEEEDEDDDFDPEIGPPLDLPPEMLAQFRELIEELRTAPDAVVRELRKSTMRDMPPFVFEALLQMARRDALPPKPHPKPPPPPRPPPAKSPPTDADPNQMNFF